MHELTLHEEPSARDWLLNRINELEHEGGLTRIELNSTKLFSIGMFGASGLLAIATVAGASALALPIAVAGAAFYLPSVMQEARKTGDYRPIPFSPTSLMGMLSQVDRSTRGGWQDEHELHSYAYLTPSQKAEYALINYLGDTLAPALDAMSPDDQRRAWRRAVFLIAERFSDEIKLSPYALEQYSKAVLSEFALSPDSHCKLLAGDQESSEAVEDEGRQEPQMSKAIGATTRLGAIPATAEPVDEPSWWQSSAQQQPTLAKPEPQQAPDVVDLIVAQGNSLVFLGGQGVGKSRLMAIASQRGLAQGKYKHVTVLSGLAKKDEDPLYWRHCTNQLFFDLAPMDERDRAAALAKQLLAIQQFKAAANEENPGVLILDEIAYQASLISRRAKVESSIEAQLEKEICDTLWAVSSGGAKRGWFVWVGTPQGAIGSMGAIGRDIKKLKPVCCAIAPMSVVSSRGHDTSWDEGLYQAAKLNFPALTLPGATLKDRIVFFGDRWMPQTRYELDSEQGQKAKATKQASQAPGLPAALCKQIEVAIKQRGAVTASEIQPLCGTIDAGLILLKLHQSAADRSKLENIGGEIVLRRKVSTPG